MLELKLIYILEIIAFLFIIFALLKKYLENFLNIKVCALCAAVSTTWIVALLLKNLMLITINNTILSIMIGQSIVGIMYSYENYVKESRSSKSLMWLKKLLIIIAGIVLGYYLIESTVFVQLCLILISLLILLIFALWFNKGFNENGNEEKAEANDNANNNDKITEHNAKPEKMENESKEDKAAQNTGIKAALLELEKKFERCCD